MKVDGKTIGDAKQFTIEEQFHDWFHEGLNAEDVSVKIKKCTKIIAFGKKQNKKHSGTALRN